MASPARGARVSLPRQRCLGSLVGWRTVGYDGDMSRLILNPRIARMSLLPLAGVVLCLVFPTGGCSMQRSPEMGGASSPEDIPILWQSSGTFSPIGRKVRVLARDAATLAQFPLTEIPVDFRTQMVLIAGLGPTPSSQQGIRIVRVWREGARIKVQERSIHPGAEQASGLEPASPWTAVVIPRSDLNVEGYVTRVPDGVLRDHPGSR